MVNLILFTTFRETDSFVISEEENEELHTTEVNATMRNVLND